MIMVFLDMFSFPQRSFLLLASQERFSVTSVCPPHRKNRSTNWSVRQLPGDDRRCVYMSALTNEANIPSSCSKRVSGLSYSKMFPRFITMTRSAVRMVWTRCRLSVAVRLQQTQTQTPALTQPGKMGNRRKEKRQKESWAEPKLCWADPGLLVSPH